MEKGEHSQPSRILLVEDEALIALDLEASLRSRGYHVVSVVSGEEAIDAAERQPPDLVLINMRLEGGMDGVQVAAALRTRHDPAIIFLTAYAEKDLIERAKSTEPYGYLTKPVSPEDLLRAVEATLYRHTMERRLRESERRLELALEGAEMAMWDWDVRTGEGIVSDRYLEMGGYERGEVKTDYRTWKQHVHPDDWPMVRAAFTAHLDGRAPIYEAEYRMKCKSGEWKWILVRGKALERSPEGKAVRMVGTLIDVDARHRVQSRLEESHELVRSVLSSLDVGVCVATYPTRIIVECNRAAEEIFGYSRDEMIGSSTRMLHVDEKAFQESGRLVQKVLDSSGIYHREFQMRRKNGEIFPTEHYVARVPSPSGKAVNVVSVIRDITQRKRDEANLARTRLLLEALNEAQSQFIARSDPQEVYDGLLNSLIKLTESESGFIDELLVDERGETYRQPRAISRTSDYCVRNPTERDQRFYQTSGLIGAVVTSGEAVITNDAHADPRSVAVPEGHPPVRSFLGLPLRARKRLVGVIGIANRPGGYDEEIVAFLTPYVATCANIIDAFHQGRLRTHTEQALRENEAKLRLITNALPVLIAYADAEQRYQFVNRTYERWAARTPEEMVGRTMKEVWPEEVYSVLRDHVKAALAGEPQSFEARMGCEGLPERDLLLNYIPHVDEEGEIRGFAALVSDITDQKTAEKRIKAALNEKEILLREIHHRVKNNLAVISSLISLQAAHAKDDFHKQMFRDVQTRVRSMAIAHEKLYQSNSLSKLSMRTYVRSLVDHLTASSAPIGSPIRLKKEVDDVTLGLDTAMPLGFILTELVSNCLKHAFPPGTRGEVTVTLRSLGENEYELVVADNGVGLPEQFSFDTLKTLGLDLVRTFATQLNGRVEIKREHGTEFCITFKDISKSTVFTEEPAD